MKKQMLATVGADLYNHGATTTTDMREPEINEFIISNPNKFVYSKYTNFLTPSSLTTQQNTKLSNKTIKQRKKNKLARKARKIN